MQFTIDKFDPESIETISNFTNRQTDGINWIAIVITNFHPTIYHNCDNYCGDNCHQNEMVVCVTNCIDGHVILIAIDRNYTWIKFQSNARFRINSFV